MDYLHGRKLDNLEHEEKNDLENDGNDKGKQKEATNDSKDDDKCVIS